MGLAEDAGKVGGVVEPADQRDLAEGHGRAGTSPGDQQLSRQGQPLTTQTDRRRHSEQLTKLTGEDRLGQVAQRRHLLDAPGVGQLAA